MRTSAVGPDGSFRFGLHTEMFSKSDFLVEGDEHNRFVGTLVLAGTPMDWLETWFFTQSSSNENTARRAEAGGDVILALGDFGFGGKGRFGGKSFSGGPETNLRFLNSVGGTTPKLSATNWYLGAVATLDPTDSGFPARAHLNVGYQVDRSRNLCPTDGACSEERFPEPVERMVEEFGQGLNRSRFQLAIGGDVPMTFDGGVFRLWPLLEYHVDVATGEPDEGYDAACDEPGSAFSQICHLGRDSQTLLLGARARPAPGLFVDVGVEFGLASPGAEYGPTPAVPLYNVVLGVSYAHDPGGVVSTAQRPAPAATASRNMGRLRGVVLDAKTGDPIEGAVVVFTGKNLTGLSTDPDGGFLSYEFESGPLALSVRHASYHSAKAEVAIVAGKDLPLEVRLKPDETAPVAPDAPATGATTLSGKVTDPSGGALRAVVRIQGAENREIETDAEGAFAADLPPGDYLARFEAADFLAKEQSFRIEEGRTQALDVVLSKRPSTPRVQISGNRIVLKGKVHFGSRNARLRPDSGQILDEVADLLLAHPEVARVRVEGHTDNRGNKRANQKLSQQRAEAVRNHLVQRGVSGERLEAVGYGASKPLVPNLGERNREKNRRVELRILN
jgi:outer membrane protein OmpA-like peptidoglycan-associated protein